MLIDWFTVGAQTLNFILLVWLLKRFLYKPVLDAVDAREQRIAAELADADIKKAEAGKERDEFQRRNEQFATERAALMARATDEADTEHRRLLDAARQSADLLGEKLRQTRQSETQRLNEDIRLRTQREVFAIARMALTDLASASLEERMTEVFAGRLRSMDAAGKEGLAKALGGSGSGLVRSSFELPAPQRAAVQEAVRETLSTQVPVRFETAPQLVCGIELLANGQKIGWNIAEYLARLEGAISELVERDGKPEIPTGSKRAE